MSGTSNTQAEKELRDLKCHFIKATMNAINVLDILMISVPCLPGDHLYYIIPGEIGSKLDPPHIFEDTCTDVSTKAIFGEDARYEKSELGKDLFLTMEEAQKELERRYPPAVNPPNISVKRCGNCKHYQKHSQFSTYGYCSRSEIVSEEYIGVNKKSCDHYQWRGY